MKYRILQKGDKFMVQIRCFMKWWPLGETVFGDFGYDTTMATKPFLYDSLQEAIEEAERHIASKRKKPEKWTVVKKGPIKPDPYRSAV